jgi:hypothetical protein
MSKPDPAEIALNERPNLRVSLAHHERLRAELLERFPELADDEEALGDTLSGESDLPETVAQIIRSALADERLAEGINEYIAKLQLRRHRLNGRAARKRALALYAMTEGNVPRITQPDFDAYTGRSRGKVIVTDEDALALEYVRLKREPDKKAIGEELRNGGVVSGAELSNPEPILVVKT